MLNIEKETSINFNDAENEAVICTYNAAWMRKLDALCERHEGFSVRKREEGYREYVVPKKYVTVRGPREMTEEQRLKSAERLRKAREAKRSGEGIV